MAEERKKPKISLSDLLCNLKTLSELQPGQKVYVEDGKRICIQSATALLPEFIERWLNGWGRSETLAAVERTYAHVFAYLRSVVDDRKRAQDAHRVVMALSQSVRGLNCLRSTYNGDINTKVKLDLISDHLQLQLHRLTARLRFEGDRSAKEAALSDMELSDEEGEESGLP